MGIIQKTLFTIFFLIHGFLFGQPILIFEEFASGGLNQVVDLRHAGDDRIFAVLQNGIIRIIHKDGQVESMPFLNISNRISTGGERGLLGLEFHRNYKENGYFFVNYTNRNGTTVISRFEVSADDPNRADPDSEFIIMTIAQPYSNHNGGDLKFGPDGYLYIGTGDGGSAGDPQNFSQNPRSLLGKMLRIDVDSETPYAIPEDNPYRESADTLPEIWQFGLRNPWRYSFDALTGDLWIADVGQNAREEINKVDGVGQGRENFGWRCFEGSLNYNLSGCGPRSDYVFPVYEYPHAPGDKSVTGGYVYRGNQYPLLYGHYVCGDFVSGRFFVLYQNNQGVYDAVIHPGIGEFQISAFGESVEAELLVAARGRGVIYKIKEFCSDYVPKLVLFEDQLILSFANATYDPDIMDIQWFRNDEPIDLGEGFWVQVEMEGYYYAEVKVGDCLMKTDEVYFEGVISSFPNDPEFRLKLIPNPASDMFYIDCEVCQGQQYEVLIVGLNGQTISRAIKNPLDTFSLDAIPSGFYSVWIFNDQLRIVKKLIVTK